MEVCRELLVSCWVVENVWSEVLVVGPLSGSICVLREKVTNDISFLSQYM